MLGLVVLAVRGSRDAPSATGRRDPISAMAVAASIAVSPVCAYVLRNLLADRHVPGIVSGTVHQARGIGAIFSDVAYIWQFYLPRLSGMHNYFPGLSTTRELWFDRFVGLYGWLDTSFPVLVDNLALIPAGMIAILTLRTLIARCTVLRARLAEFSVYLVMSAGLLALIGQASLTSRLSEGVGYAQPRYLLPLLPLAAAILALAVRGAGRRWGSAFGARLLSLFMAQDIFSQLLVVSRYYL